MALKDWFNRNRKPKQNKNLNNLNTIQTSFSKEYGIFANRTKLSSIHEASALIKQGYESNPIVFSVVSKIANTASLLTYKLRNKRTLKDAKNIEIETILKNPNNNMNWTEFVQTEISYNLVTGSSILHYQTDDNSNKVFAINVLPVQDVQLLDNYNYNVGFVNIPIQDTSMRTYPQLDPLNKGFWGLSPLTPLSTSIQVSNQIFETQYNTIKNFGVIGLLTGKDSASYSEDSLRKVQNNLDNRINNSKDAGKITITDQELDYLDFGKNATELELIEVNKQFQIDVCNVYGMPISLFNNDASTFNNLKEAEKILYNNTVLPQVNSLIESLNKNFVETIDPKLELYVDTTDIEALQADLSEKAAWIQTIKPEMTINEVRSLFNLDVIDGERYNTVIRDLEDQSMVDDMIQEDDNTEDNTEEE